MRAFSPAGLASLLILTACGGGTEPTNPPPPPPPPGSGPVASLGLSRDAATLVLPATLQLVATPRNASGNPLGGRTVTWTSRAPAIAGVSASGLVSSVAPGTAVIDATSEGVTASATITVLPDLGGATLLQSGSVTLPAGAQIAAWNLTVQNSLGSATPGPSGGFALLSSSSGPQLAAGFATGGRPILLGWLDAQHTTLTTRTTAEALAYFDLGGPMLPRESRAFVMQELTRRSELTPLEDAIKAALAADPATVTLDVPAVHQARLQVQASLLTAALATAARAPRAPQHTVQIDPLAPKSGIAVNETDLNTIVITNQYRRRAVALLDRVSYVGANGGSAVPAPARIQRAEVEATTGVTSVSGLLSDVVLGNLAWAEVDIDPIPIPLSPTNARSTQYRLMVLGLGETNRAEQDSLTAAEHRELDLVVAKTMFLDLFLPLLSNVFLDGAVAGDAVDDYLDSPIGAAALSDFLDVMFSTVPEVFTKAYAGDYRGAARDLITEFGDKDTFQFEVFELMAAIASARLANPGSVQGAISEFGGKLLGFVGKIDLWMTVFDSCLQLWQIGNSRAIEKWNLNVVPSEIALNPPQSKIGKTDIQLLKATVKGLENLAPGAALAYKWTTPGLHGGLYDANNRNVKQIIGSGDAVTYTPNMQSSGIDQITVEVKRIQAGVDTVVIGSASATVEVVDLAISLTPEGVSLRGGEQQAFAVTVPAALKGTATLSYRWSTTGDFGTLDRGSKSFQSASSTATYTARSQTRGDDEVTVEVLATQGGQTASLGMDRVWVRVERTPFNLLPANVRASKDTTVNFVARPNGDLPPNVKYVWTFGDGSPAATLNDSVTTHRFVGQGTYQVSVEMQDAATGRRLASAAGTVTIGFSVSIVPNPANTPAKTPLVLTASLAGPPIPAARYWWNFDDGTTLRVDGNNTVSHSWTTEGTFEISVLLEDPITGADLAQATGVVVVEDPVDAPVWRITRLALESLTGDIPHDSLARNPNLVAYGSYFRQKEKLSWISSGAKTAYVHALDGSVSLPDCFDFDFDGNKAEVVTWPAWIWLQFPNELPSAACGGDKVLGHFPVAPSWDLGFDWSTYFQGDIVFDYPAPFFASVSLGTGTGSLSGRGLFEWVCCGTVPGVPGAGLAEVYALTEITATITGRTLSGQLTFIYTLPPNDVVPRQLTWKAVYSFDATQGR